MADNPSKNLKVDLVLEGGGVKGIGLVGAIGTLKNKGYSFQRVAGTSAGAIVGSLVAAGMDTEKMIKTMQSLDYKLFQDDTLFSRFGPPGKIISLLTQNGLYKGDYLKNWIAGQLADCGVKTFGDLKLDTSNFGHLPKNKAYRLVVVTADLSKGDLVYLPWDYHRYGLDPDNQPVAEAIRASMSIPFFYKPAHLSKSTLVDGGVLSNFPVDAFDLPTGTLPRWPTFGIKLSAEPQANQVPHHISGPLSLADALFSTMMNAHDQRHLDDPCTLRRTMFVDTDKIQSTDFDITKAQQEFLFTSGQKAAQKFLDKWDFAKFKKDFCET